VIIQTISNRKSSISFLVGADGCAPMRVTEIAATRSRFERLKITPPRKAANSDEVSA